MQTLNRYDADSSILGEWYASRKVSRKQRMCIQSAGLMARLNVKVVPGASSAGIAGWLGDVLKLRVTAPPEKGKANKMVRQLIADSLGLALNNVQIVSGEANARKTLELDGISETEMMSRLKSMP